MIKNNKILIIIGIGIIILSYFGFQNSQLIEKENEKYIELRKIDLQKEHKKIKKTDYSKKTSNSFNNKKKFTYSSLLNDKEINGEIVQTNRELTYHTFDFENKIVTMKFKVNGNWTEFIYPIKSMYEENGIYATTYVLRIGKFGVKEIWWSPDVLNLGYDFDDGSRISCYELKKIK